MQQNETRAQILEIARDLLAGQGLAGLSFDAIARQMGRSKQAILYWYPSKSALIAALFLPWLSAEANAAEAAVAQSRSESEAIADFVRAIAAFHMADLDRFRMMYMVPQTVRPRETARTGNQALEQVHQVTDRLYGALASRLAPRPASSSRARALTIHSAVLGLILMVSLSEAVNDPLKHATDDLVAALIASLTAPGSRD